MPSINLSLTFSAPESKKMLTIWLKEGSPGGTQIEDLIGLMMSFLEKWRNMLFCFCQCLKKLKKMEFSQTNEKISGQLELILVKNLISI